MPVIDERGRLFGKLNVIDAVVILCVVVLIPVAYGAYLLFRTPQPTITSVEPATLTQATPPAPPVVMTLRGENLRPYLRARVGTTFIPFLIETPGVAELKLPADFAPGTYDLALFDEAQQVAIKPGALTVVPPLAVAAPASLRLDVQVVGAFIGLSSDDAKLIGPGSISPIAEVLAVRPPQPGTVRVKLGTNAFATTSLPGEVRVAAILRLSCAVVGDVCKVGETPLAQNAVISLPLTSPVSKDRPAKTPARQVGFVIDQVFTGGTRASFPAVGMLRVRFVGEPEILDAMRAGDVDLADAAAPTEGGRAVLTQIGSDRKTMTGVTSTDGILHRSVQLDQPLLAFVGTVRVPLVFTPAGWSYKDRLVKVGAAFTFETISGGMVGVILEVRLGQEK